MSKRGLSFVVLWLALLVGSPAEAQLSISASATSVPNGQSYTITCTVVIEPDMHEYRCDGTAPFSCANGVCTRTLTYTRPAGTYTHTVTAKHISDGTFYPSASLQVTVGVPPPPPEPPPPSPCTVGPFTLEGEWVADQWTQTFVDPAGCPTVLTLPLAPRVDTFDRPDGSSGPNWAWQFSSAVGAIRSGSLGGASGTGLIVGWWTPETFADRQFSEIVVSAGFNPVETYALQVFVRRQASSLWRYGFHYQPSTGKYTLKYDGGSSTVVLAETSGAQFAPGDVVRIEAYGTTIRGLLNGVVILTATHTALTGGQTGLVINQTYSTAQQAIDVWRGGSLP